MFSFKILRHFAVMLCLVLTVLGSLSGAQASLFSNRPKFFAAVANEAQLSFRGKILLISDFEDVKLSDFKKGTQLGQAAQEEIYWQLSFLIGYFQSEGFIRSFKGRGVLGENYNVVVTKVGYSGNPNYPVAVEYDFTGKMLMERSLQKNREIEVVMPISPQWTFDDAMIDGKNRCTDPHYQSYGDFFYFFDPRMPGCPLNTNKRSLFKTMAGFKVLPNTKATYPEYDKLYSSQRTLKISTFFGYIGDNLSLNKVHTQDEGYYTAQGFVQELKALGFIQKKNQFGFSMSGQYSSNMLQVFAKSVNTQLGTRVNIEVEVFLGHTDAGSDDDTFRRYFAKALETSSIVVYDGHSGLGGNLSLETLSPVRFDRNLYQIMMFNGCSSYPYFNGDYFRAKGGSRNLEIITSGTSTYSSTAVGNLMGFITPFLKGEIKSYQNIMWEVEKSNESQSTYLFGVNGDEDNLFKPQF
jgi:hypothetical protein